MYSREVLQNFYYLNCRIIVMRLNNRVDMNAGVEFIKGDKGFCERDAYLELGNVPAGVYYILVEADRFTNEQLDIAVTCYGSGISVFESDDAQYYRKEVVLDKAFRSRIKKEPRSFNVADFEQ